MNKCSNYWRSVGKQWSIFPRALEENGMRPTTCPSELVMFSCHQTLAQSSEFRADDTPVLCDDVNHEKSIHVRTCVGRNFGSPSPPKKKLRYPHLEHPLSHGRIDLQRDHSKRFASLQGLPKMIFVIHHFGPSNN